MRADARFNDTFFGTLLLRNLIQLSFRLALITSTIPLSPIKFRTNCSEESEFDSNSRKKFCIPYISAKKYIQNIFIYGICLYRIKKAEEIFRIFMLPRYIDMNKKNS